MGGAGPGDRADLLLPCAAVRLKIFFHDNCFDGATSAALFAAFYRDRRRGSEISLQGVQHRRGDPFQGLAMDGDDNACVDFRYSADPRMTWWFDHHVSAFQPSELRQHFDADQSGQKFFDPTSPSCSIFMWDTLQGRFEFRPDDRDGHWAELIHWADIIDAARFDSPKMAVELEPAALRIMTWLEHNQNAEHTHRLIGELGARSLDELAEEPWIREPLAPLLATHQRNIELIGKRLEMRGEVAFFDLADDGIAAHNKFIAYLHEPDAAYTVGVTVSPDRSKVSVGSNPWQPERRRHNIAAICERFGGGGHPVVGAVSLPSADLTRAREIAEQICQELNAPAH